jgi:adenine deaminase
MHRLDGTGRAGLIEAARGTIEVDLCLRNAGLVNVFNGQVETADLAVHGGRIAGWGTYRAKREIDLAGMFVAPGFIDGHLHIESTLLAPTRFADAVVPRGTSAVVADPHEIANVLGLSGIRYFLDASEGLPVDIFFMLPSCVPASPFEMSGAVLRGPDLFSLLPHPRILGLAEMMNFPGVIEADPVILDKLTLFQDHPIDGHAPQLGGNDLNAYLAGGIATDHECTQLYEAREKLAKGMAIMIREGSQSKDMEALFALIDESTWPRCLWVSDDRHPDELTEHGHMDGIINKAMDLGLDPVRAITLGSWTAANLFNLRGRGALAPGYLADFSISPTLYPWRPVRVFKLGREVARDGEMLSSAPIASHLTAPASPMSVASITPQDLRAPAEAGRLKVIEIVEGSLLTRKRLCRPRVENGAVIADPDRDILKLVVINRYGGPNPTSRPAIGFIKGMGLKTGALASTVAHDSHNLIAVGASDPAICRAVEALRESRGGMVATDDDKVVAQLPLPIAGLMTDESATDVAEALKSVQAAARRLGSPLTNPLMALSFMALPVIPELKLTDQGLVDVATFSFTPLYEK